MASYFKKSKTEILKQALDKATKHTDIKATSPGSVFRMFTEAITTEIGDLYDVLDFNLNQYVITSASGNGLDMLGQLYGVNRKQVGEMEATDKRLGSFIFYIRNPHTDPIVIPKGTNVYQDKMSYIGRHLYYSTAEDVVIPAGRTRAYASLIPGFDGNPKAADRDTLIIHDYSGLPGEPDLYCTNPKVISAALQNETDDQFRARILKQIRVSAGGTEQAARFAGLSILGIRDVKIRSHPYGMGTFEAIIVPDSGTNPSQAVALATAAISEVRPAGVKMFVKTPVMLPFNISVDIVAPTALGGQSKEAVLRRVQVGIARYVNSLLPGSELVYNQLLQIIMDASEQIKDVVIKSMSINGAEVMRRNYRPREDEQITVGSNITVNIAKL